ncbi:MAG: S-methyl-5'-thioadenosine phosphorylase, partial [bacterium]
MSPTQQPPIKIGVIGGSGLYDLEGLTDLEEVQLSTPYGEPSDALRTAQLDGIPVVLLPRHGR